MNMPYLFSNITWFYVALSAFIWVNLVLGLQIFEIWRRYKISMFRWKKYGTSPSKTIKIVGPLLSAFIINSVMISIAIWFQVKTPVSAQDIRIITVEARSIENLLAERLPDADTQKLRHESLIKQIENTGKEASRISLLDDNIQLERHKELLHALQEMGSQGSRPIKMNDEIKITTFSLFLMLSLVLLFTGIISSRIEKNNDTLKNEKKFLRKHMTFSNICKFGSLISISISFTANYTFNNEWTFFKIDYDYKPTKELPQSPQNLSVYIASMGGDIASNVKLDCGVGAEHKIWPFPDRTINNSDFQNDSFFENKEVTKTLNDTISVLNTKYKSKPFRNFVLIGSADKQPLNERAQQKYETNFGLAQARADWVKHKLETPFPKVSTLPIMIYVADSSSAGLVSSKTINAEDRAVVVCTF